MKITLKGFVEGTTHITTGDKMKPGDHCRDKRKCFHYFDGHCSIKSEKCTGSSHCGYYDDGIRVRIYKQIIPNIHRQQNLLLDFLKNIPHLFVNEALESEFVKWMILKRYDLSLSKIIESEEQLKNVKIRKSCLQKEIEKYNDSLKSKCVAVGLLIITAPFCYAYYLNHARDYNKEAAQLERRYIDCKLQQKVKLYKSEIKEYESLSKSAKKKTGGYNKEDSFYVRAKHAYSENEQERFYEMIHKSIKERNNINAVLLLANELAADESNNQSELYSLYLFLYASYLGDKASSKILGNILLDKDPKSSLGRKFIDKSKGK